MGIGMVEMLKWQSPAAGVAADEGKDWNSLSREEKEAYVRKAQDQAYGAGDTSGFSQQVKDNDDKRQKKLNKTMGR